MMSYCRFCAGGLGRCLGAEDGLLLLKFEYSLAALYLYKETKRQFNICLRFIIPLMFNDWMDF